MLKIQEKNKFRPLESPKAVIGAKIISKPPAPRPPDGVGRGRQLATSPIPPENLLKNHPMKRLNVSPVLIVDANEEAFLRSPLRRPKVAAAPAELLKDDKENDSNGNFREVPIIKEKLKQETLENNHPPPLRRPCKTAKWGFSKVPPRGSWYISVSPSATLGFSRYYQMKRRSPQPKVASPPAQLLKEEKENDLNGNVFEFAKIKEELKQESNLPKKDVNENIMMSNTPMMEKSDKNSANISLEKSLNLLDYAQKLPHSGSKFFQAELDMVISNLGKPIGIALLPQSKKIVIGDTASDQVKMFSRHGDFIKYINPPAQFERPSDMTAFENDEFAIKDNVGIHIFDDNGDFKNSLINPKLGKLFGLATDGNDLLYTINTNRNSNVNNVTKVGESDIVVLKKTGSGEISKRIELVDVIADKSKTACRFLHYANKMLFIVDLGLDCVYQLKLKTIQVKKFGATGYGNGRFIDPAGLDTDSEGNIIINDAGNDRLQVRITKYLILKEF